ncbi:MATE family efflux transporter [Vibrio mexicanus]|uniref:MATE family efflux transporter n=1 Tax=Vibrio mexicanus TaxID=1004326 RepID=UPI001EE1A0F1|nr:MATE family efflux transporter [Vibrio mexicanus]
MAALSVMTPIESITLALMIGLSSAAGVLTGNQLGAKKYDEIYYQAIGMILLNVIVSVVVAIGLYLSYELVLGLFTALTPETRELSEKFIVIVSIGMVLKSVPMMAIMGVLRAGGDVKFCLYQDLIAQWLISIPLAAFAAIGLGFEPEWIFLLFLVEELVKWFGSLHRVKSKKWMRNLIEN